MLQTPSQEVENVYFLVLAIALALVFHTFRTGAKQTQDEKYLFHASKV